MFRGASPPWDPHRGLRPQAQDTFGMNPLCQQVIGYHWLAFLNQVRNQFITNVGTKSTISQKLEKKLVNFLKICFRTSWILWDDFLEDSKNLERPYISQKLKIGKLIFHSFHNIAQIFLFSWFDELSDE